MRKGLKDELLESGFNKKLNYILKKCNEISSSVTGLNKKLLEVEREYSVELFDIDMFDSIKESKKYQLKCIENSVIDLLEITKEMTCVSVISGYIGSFEGLSDEELMQYFNKIKEYLADYSSTILSMCNPDDLFLREFNYVTGTANIYSMFAKLFKIAANLKGYYAQDIIVKLFWTISIKGENKNK